MTRLARFLVAGAIVVVATSWWYGRYKDAQAAAWRRRAEDALVIGNQWRAAAESLREGQGQRVRVVTRLRVRVDTLRLAAESALTHSDTAAAIEDFRQAASLCAAANDTLLVALALCDRRATLLQARGDSLDRVVREGLAIVRPRRWGCTVGAAGLVWFHTGALGVGATCGRIL